MQFSREEEITAELNLSEYEQIIFLLAKSLLTFFLKQ